MVEGAEKSGNWYRGVVDAAARFITKWHRTEADKSWPMGATSDGKNSNKAKLDGGGGGGVPIHLWTNVESKWHTLRQGTGSTNMWSVFKYSKALKPIVSGSVLPSLYSSSSMLFSRFSYPHRPTYDSKSLMQVPWLPYEYVDRWYRSKI